MSSTPPRRRKKRGPGRPPRSESRHTRGDIIKAAEHLFAKEGYHGTSLRKIAALSHVDLATIKYHFADKQTLYNEAFMRAHHRLVERFTPSFHALRDAETYEEFREKINAIAIESAQLLSKDAPFVRTFFYRTLEGFEYTEEIVDLYMTDITATIHECLRPAIERKFIRDIDADAFAMLLFVAIPSMNLATYSYGKLTDETARNTGMSTSAVKQLSQNLLSTILLDHPAAS